MMKVVIILGILAAVLGQEREFTIDNMVNYDELPYQTIYPYPYQEDRERSFLREPIVNANNEFRVVALPATLKEIKQVRKLPSTGVKSILFSVVSKMIGIAKALASEFMAKAPGLIFGAFVVVLFCKITSVCTKISGIKSLSEAQREFSAFITPERLNMATEIVHEAIRRYRSIQSD